MKTNFWELHLLPVPSSPRGRWGARFLLGLGAFVATVAAPAPVAAQTPDTTPPTITAVPSSTPNANGWYRSSVRVQFVCADPGGSGIASYPAARLITTEGSAQRVTGVVSDRAGNTASASLTLNLDRTPPILTAVRTPAAGPNGWVSTPVTVTFSARDALSGVMPGSLTPPITYATDRNSTTATGRATDRAGNVGTVSLPGIRIDTKKPTIAVALQPAPTGSGWYNAPVTAHFTCTDSGSGIASCPSDQLFSNEGRNQTVTGTAVDNVGLSSTITRTFQLDLTPPTLVITSPTVGQEVQDATFTVSGSATDNASGIAAVTLDGTPVSLDAAGSFVVPVNLVEGLNSFTVVASDRVGRSSTRTVTVTRTTPNPTQANLFADPGFESGVSSVVAQDASSSVSLSTQAPLQGSSSLRVSINGYGNNVWWSHAFEGGLASHFLVRARARSDVSSASSLEFCAMIYFADGSTDISCATLSGTAGDKGTATAQLPIDPTKRLQSVNLRLYQEGGAPVTFTLDDAGAYLDVVEAPPSGGGGGGGGGDGGGGGGGSTDCPPVEPGNSAYPGFAYHLPQTRPFLSLSSYTQAPPTSTAYLRFQTAADQAVAGHPPYAYSAVSSVTMYRITDNPVYLEDAIARVEGFVSEAEAAIAAGNNPPIAGDSYLEIGWYLEQLALAYDAGFDQLTPGQRARWVAFADQAIFNLWHPSEAAWGGVVHPWTGWSICDPGNNYHFHFLRATMLWALATQSAPLLEFLQTQKFTRLVDYYAGLPGGGSREGTGYGTAQKDLFENYLLWKDSTGEDLSGLTAHARETIDYWVHATVPTRDRFAPIGDQSRSSMPELFDYHENLVHTAVVLHPGTPEAARGTWWLNHNSVNGVSQAFNLLGDLLPLPDAPIAPVDRVYHATGAGVLFARSSWNTDASWLSFVAGKYDQSHAHQDQGSFTFFKGDWLAVTPNIWSHSGIHQETEFHNTVRFERADGSVIPQTPSTAVQSSMTCTTAGGLVSVVAELANAFSGHADLVQQWTRRLEYAGDTLRVFDTCTVATGVRPVFQLQVPVLPVAQADGSLLAGHLRIVPLQGVAFTVHVLPSEFSQGYRVDVTSTVGPTFALELRWQ